MNKKKKNRIFDSEIVFKPDKSLGQNFITDENYLKEIVSLFNISDNSLVIEIGTGYGKMTKIIKEETKCKKIISIEKSKDLFDLNNENKKLNWGIDFIHADVLKIDWQEIISKKRGAESYIIVLGNLPFNISNSLIINLLLNEWLFDEFIFLVQKEVGEKWSSYKEKKYNQKKSAVSAFIWYHCDIEIIVDKVSKNIFKPIPKVDGMIVRLKNKKKKIFDDNNRLDKKNFFKFLKEMFLFRRKIILKRLISVYKNKKEEIFSFFFKKKINEKARIQEIDLKDVLDLFFVLKRN